MLYLVYQKTRNKGMIFSNGKEYDITELKPVEGKVLEKTEPTSNPRITLRKTYILVHRPKTKLYCFFVKLDKLIDENTTMSWSWIEEPTPDEIKEFKKEVWRENLKKAAARKTQKQEEKRLRQKEYGRIYYQKNKERIIERIKEYNRQHTKELTPEERQKKLQQKKEYYRTHKEQWVKYKSKN